MSAKATREVSILEPLCILKQLRDLLNYYKFSWNFIRATKSQIGEAKKKKKSQDYVQVNHQNHCKFSKE